MFKSVLQCSSYFVGIYLVFGLKVHFFRGVGGINFCSLPYTVPSGSSAPSLTKEDEGRASAKREFDGMGRTDGTDGLDGDQKCPLIFFILCGYIDKVYTYLYRY